MTNQGRRPHPHYFLGYVSVAKLNAAYTNHPFLLTRHRIFRRMTPVWSPQRGICDFLKVDMVIHQ
jgi:hypothetical protein